MKLMKTNVYGISVILITLSSCIKNDNPFENQVKEDTKKIKTYLESKKINAIEIKDGFHYEVVESNSNGQVIKNDDIVEFYYKISLLDNKLIEDKMDETKNAPLLFKKGNNAFWPSGLEKGISLMHVGEHYRFYLPSYMAYYSYGHSDFFPSFSNFIIDIKINSILSEQDILSNQLASIEASVEENVYENVEKQTSGLYYIKTKEGSGKKPKSNSYITIKWTRKYLDGTIIASTGTSSQAYYLKNDNIVEGLKEGIQLMEEGEKAIFLMPSKLAFGPSLQVLPHTLREQLYKEKSINYDIEPYSPLQYEIELIKVD